MDATLTGPRRDRELAELAGGKVVDVLVVGLGVTGAGVALDAASRGLSVAAVEAHDLAHGTSRWSSKLVHGGLRYLAHGQVGIAYESAVERHVLMTRTAPHLIRALPMLLPMTEDTAGWQDRAAAVGLRAGDLLRVCAGTTRRTLPGTRRLGPAEAGAMAPALRRVGLHGAHLSWDGQLCDDARLVVGLSRAAAARSARILPRARVVELHGDGATVEDTRTGETLHIAARAVINATGVWTDDIQSLVGERGPVQVRASKGIHLVVPRDRIRSTTGLILRTESSVLFVIPWGRHWLIGTTDSDWDLDKAHPAATSRDIDYLLERVNEVLAIPLTRDDVEGVYAGLRPLLSGQSDATAKLSREHTVASSMPGLVMVAGGKYTTYRVMARDAVDEAVRGLGGGVPRSCTDRVPLLGAEGYVARWNQRRRIARQYNLTVERVEHLLRRYGAAVDEVLDLLGEDPTLVEPLDGADDYLRVEVVHAASAEGALHLEDVLTRRTHISIETFDRGLAAARPAAQLMASVLGWDAERVDREVAHYVAQVDAERMAHDQIDDQAADAARLVAPDVVPQVALAA